MTGRRITVFCVLVLLTAAALSYWVVLGRPVAVVDAHAGRISCVSYAPYRLAGESPFNPLMKVSAERIEEDLSALSRRFDCVRTYSVGQGLDQVPAIARKHHMKVLMGIWLSRTAADNDKEIALGIDTARSNHDVIRAVIVGNEVLLRGELAPDALAADIARVKGAIDLPVTYADVWEFWLKYPQIAPVVSFITIHILPYWEDEPVPIDQAVRHVAEIRTKMQAAFPDRKLLIGETGWPSAGRQRQAARPSLVNEARFMREFLNWAQTDKVEYNVIEAFDQPWKRLLEGTAGGYWGVYDAHLHEKFAQTGPVVEEALAPLGLVAAALGALGLLMLDMLWRRRRFQGGAAALLCGAAIGAVTAAQVRELVRDERDLPEWLVGAGLSVLALASALLLARFLIDWLAAERTLPRVLSIARLRWRDPRTWWSAGALIGLIRFFWLFAAAVMNLLLVFDARYRDFPIFLYALQVLGLAMLSVADRAATVEVGVEEKLLASWVGLSALILIITEGPSNGPAMVWVALSLVLSQVIVWPWWRASRGGALQPRQHHGT
jgi:glucan 1,3-beta-glucosidase